jgi:receptor protein-tyrosine kinase
MDLHDFVKVIRSRWLIIVAGTLAGLLGAIAVTFLTTPLYQASTRLFVSSTAGASASELFQGNRLSQDRVLSYTELLKGRTLAERTVDKLQLDMTADQLREKTTASSKIDTVLINVSVLDESPVRARDIANAVSEEFVVMIRELETPAPGARPDARVVVEQRASVPEKPVIPKTARNLLAGVALGLTLGVGLAVFLDMMDNTVKDREVLEEITGVGLVGTIPMDKTRIDKPAISFEDDTSATAESFRKLRTNLQFLTVDNPPKVIVVVSAEPSEGKSTTAINTALALAEAGNNVALIDGDMRKPSLHKYMDLIGSVGFSSVLSGSTPLSDVLQATRFPGLTVLAAGPTPPNPSELLGSMAAKNLLAELRSQFDYVIIDSAPLLAVTDGALLSASADGALIAARFGKTKREQMSHAVGTLRGVGATVLGAVFTMIPTRGTASYNYNYNYRYYGEGEDKRKSKIRRTTTSSQHGEANL